MVAIDLDGTLLRSDKQVSAFDIEVIQKAVLRGVKVVLATARPPRSSREIHELLGLDTPLINYNGALIHDRAQARHVFHEPLAADTARQMIDLARSIDPQVVISIEVLDKSYTDYDDPNMRTETIKRFKHDFIGPLDVPLADAVTKLMFMATDDRITPIRKAMKAEFVGRAAFQESDSHLLQVTHEAVDKGRAVQWVAGGLGIAQDRCMAIGDAPNDAAMLRWAGLGCAVANAFGDARDAADVIVEGNDDEGVGHAIEDYVL